MNIFILLGIFETETFSQMPNLRTFWKCFLHGRVKPSKNVTLATGCNPQEFGGNYSVAT
jgi:hypothetical protein